MAKKISKPKNNKSPIELTEKYLYGLADAGSKESIIKLEKYLKAEKDADKKALIQMALDECEFYYYTPTSDKEEDEFYLLKQMQLRRRRVEELEDELMQQAEIIDQRDLEAKIHSKVLAKNKDRKEDWKYNFIPDNFMRGLRDAHLIINDFEYEEAWIAEAKKTITTPRYKNMPDRFLEHYDIAGNDANDEDCGCDDEDDCCDCGCENGMKNDIDPSELPF